MNEQANYRAKLVTTGTPTGQATPLLAPENYQHALALRKMALVYEELPRYLLAPEVAALLHYLPDWPQHALVNLLWNTGARINEALSLRRRDIRLTVEMPHMVLRTAKQRRNGPGRPAKGKSANRLIPLTDPHFVDELRRLFASTKEQFEIDSVTGERTPLPIWQATDRTVRNWLTKAERQANSEGVYFSVPVTPHVFRHSYAMHMLYQGTPLKVLQGLMGHEKAESTEVYTRVFALDIVANRQVQFSVPAQDAIEMMRTVHAQPGLPDNGQ
ncbi:MULTISPECIES: tyrosine-type recombinase/integrase [Serratia]|uniref:tyrosine-type recombinase/integrase n=1 Tax=Serratia TaxID=613 RepID=UPI00080FDA45|nr:MULTISPECIES: tyrosine-type recombinase/integrase [Serratia]OCJ37348.1 resolvase [Serratia sp. 14-2641]QXN65252.1 tyrosine-type recombinase/integrase [Serratia fonticola]